MSVREDIKTLFVKENLTIKEAAEIFNRKNRNAKKVTPDGLSKKIRFNTMKYNEAQELIEALGYKIEIKKAEIKKA